MQYLLVSLLECCRFSKSTGPIVNPRKCRAYFGAVDDDTRATIRRLTTFKEGTL